MYGCQRPQSSAQRTWKTVGPFVSTYATLSTPGFASAFTPSSTAQKEWMASSEVTWSSTVVFAGR